MEIGVDSALVLAPSRSIRSKKSRAALKAIFPFLIHHSAEKSARMNACGVHAKSGSSGHVGQGRERFLRQSTGKSACATQGRIFHLWSWMAPSSSSGAALLNAIAWSVWRWSSNVSSSSQS